MRDNRFEEYLFSAHSRATIRHWARSLRHVRFCKAFGGHANDGDAFRCSIRFRGEAGLLEVCRSLSLRLAPLPLDSPRPMAGRSYSMEEFQKFRRPTEAFPHYEQPGHTTVFGVPVFVWIARDSVDIHLSGAEGDSYAATDADFQNAKRLDAELERLRFEFRDPPQDSPHCICPHFWPEFFTDDGPRFDCV